MARIEMSSSRRCGLTQGIDDDRRYVVLLQQEFLSIAFVLHSTDPLECRYDALKMAEYAKSMYVDFSGGNVY